MKTNFVPEISKNGIENKNFNDLFAENDKVQKTNTRAVEKYKVQHAKTVRFDNSPPSCPQIVGN